MPASRPQWKGYLKLSLVSCPIAIYPAVSAAERISFRQINRNTGNRLRQQLVDAVTGETVESWDKGRGYEVGESSFLVVEDDELQAAREQAQSMRPGAVTVQPPAPAAPIEAPARKAERAGARAAAPGPLPTPAPEPPRVVVENTRTIDIERFIPRGQIDARYVEKPYYIAPRDAVGREAFAVIRDALESQQLVGIGRVILQSRERPIALEPMGKGLRGVTLRHAHEVLSEAEYFAGIPDIALPEEMLDIAEHIMQAKKADFDPSMLEDRYRTALVEILRTKKHEMPVTDGPVQPSSENVINLMDALRRSMDSERPSIAKLPPRRAASKPASARRSSTRGRSAS
jgi:non-homologous end joining protein Ku